MNSSNMVDRTLQDIAAEVSELAYPDDAGWEVWRAPAETKLLTKT